MGMRHRRRAAAALGALVIGLAGGVAGCGGSGSGGDLSALKVGVLAPLTGDLDDLGAAGAEAARIAGAEVNRAAEDAGAELRMELVVEDTGTDAQGSQEAATKLIESDGVSALAGPWSSSEVYPTAENVAVPSGIPLLTPSSTEAAVTDILDDGLVARTAPSDALQAPVLADLVADAIGSEATLVTAHRNDAYGNGLMAAFTEAWEAGGGTVLRNVSYNPEATSLDSEARQIARGNPDGWVIIDYPGTWTTMGAALVRTGRWDPARTFSADGLRSESLPNETSGAATEGMRGTAPTSIDAPAGEAFHRLWRATTDLPRQTYDANNFDAVIVLALAAAAAGSTDPGDIADELQAVTSPPGEKHTFETLDQAIAAAEAGEDVDYEGASGPIDLDANGDPSASDYITWIYRNGGLVDTDEIISTGGGEGG
jgi:ABC-type branched-subunit amino acid transport system substrate-binding protein